MTMTKTLATNVGVELDGVRHDAGVCRRYVGAMGFDSEHFCFQIATVLQSHIGLSIKEIGNIDLP